MNDEPSVDVNDEPDDDVNGARAAQGAGQDGNRVTGREGSQDGSQVRAQGGTESGAQGAERGGGRPPRTASRALRIAAFVLPAVLVLGAGGGGIAYISATVGDASTKVPTRLWGQHAQPSGKKTVSRPGEGRHDTALSKLLLPATSPYRLGPDIGSYGNDAELTAKQAEAVIKEGGKGLSGTRRSEWNQRVEKWGVQGEAMRSYAADDNGLVVQFQLAKATDTKTIRDQFTSRTALLKLAGGRPGPGIDGHRSSAACFLLPRAQRSTVDAMSCIAHEGDVLVTVSASFTATASHKDAAAALVGRQLDYIKSPGDLV
ncbi:hypothetical protein [Streptomyces sp. NBC_00859]|uniref:hypothetical protein n=1 Tax=Streptomyces sp. NBC_00859 TaxID=2903682 RepID=UPI00386E366E|nr:hypothetical protein OG584_18790 [Streptomyces sp. NBC_00859]